MLDLHRLSAAFDGFDAYQANEYRRMRKQVARAREALRACSPAWEALRKRIARGRRRGQPLVAGLTEAPDAAYDPPQRPTPVTVVATDGSQVYPDRHVEPSCFLLNISRVAFQYGTLERPILEAHPYFRYRRDDLEGHFDALTGTMTSDLVSALRDEEELKALLVTARAARVGGRPLVAMADGTLIRWMLRAMRNRVLEQELIARYTAVLADFQAEHLPLCSYISMPGNTEVVNLLQWYLEEESAPPDPDVSGLPDRRLFFDVLRPGQRSATFISASLIQQEYPSEDQICYFYVAVPAAEGRTREIARVEVPRWVAEDEALLALVHAVVVSECEKGEGYPVVLTEAHEHAVVRTREKELFYQMIERELQGARLPYAGSRKRASKRRPTV